MSFQPRSVRLPAVLFSVGLLAAASTAQANCSAMPLPPECLTFAFTASADIVSDPNGVFGAVGPSVSGTFTFDASTPDFFPGDPTTSFYEDALKCVSVNLGTRTFHQELGFASTIIANNDLEVSGPGFTSFGDSYTVDMGLDDASIDGQPGSGDFLFELATVCFVGMGGTCPPTAMSSDALPTTPLDVNAFPEINGSSFEVRFFPQLGQLTATITGLPTTLTSVAPTPCPEPTSAAGGLVCALSLGWMARRRQRWARRRRQADRRGR